MQTKEGMHVRILTYNIHGLPWIKYDLPMILSWCFTVPNADVICLQEVWDEKDRKQVYEYARRHNWHCYFPYDPVWLGSILRGMSAGSGLCILTNTRFQMVKKPEFHPFTVCGGVDSIMTKGYFIVELRGGGKIFNIVNTHLQSDFTEFSCCRINYLKVRKFQEFQMYVDLSKKPNTTLIIGDMNMSIFKWFERVDPHDHITFPETEEHLDHLICLKEDFEEIRHVKTDFYDKCNLSDHIPVVFEVEL
jgi:endonuclease/exonuclease/phosphatase family metal-dependent hydrolase